MSLITFVLKGGIPPIIQAKEKHRREKEKADASPRLKAKGQPAAGSCC